MDEIENLGPKERKMLEDMLKENLYDRNWCENYRINYANPDIEKAREKTYKELEYLSRV